MIVFGAGLREGNKHDPQNLPVVVAGRAGGRLAAGQHLTYDNDMPLPNLWLAILDVFGTPVERFAEVVCKSACWLGRFLLRGIGHGTSSGYTDSL